MIGGRSSANYASTKALNESRHEARLTADSSDMGFQVRVSLTELSHEQLHLVDRPLVRLDGLAVRRRRLLERVRRRVVAVADEPEHHVAAIVLHLAVGELALDGDVRDAADLREGVVDVRVRADAVRCCRRGRAVAVDLVRERCVRDFRRDLGETDADGPDFGAEDLAVVERLARSDGVVESLKVDELRGQASTQSGRKV